MFQSDIEDHNDISFDI